MAKTTPDEVAKKLTDADRLREFKHGLLTKVVLTALRNSQPRTPVRTGTLRRSETTRVERAGERGFLGSNLNYALAVHEGIKGRKGQPFFRQGIEDSRGAIERLVQEAGNDYLEGIAE